MIRWRVLEWLPLEPRRPNPAPDFFRRPRLARRTRGPEWSGRNFRKA